MKRPLKYWTGRLAGRILIMQTVIREKRIRKKRMSDPIFGKIKANKEPRFDKQIAEGWLTKTSIVIGLLVTVFAWMGKDFPREEAEALVNWAESAWPYVAQGVALIAAFYGRIRVNWRGKALKLTDEDLK